MANKDSMIGPNNIQGIDPTLLQLLKPTAIRLMRA